MFVPLTLGGRSPRPGSYSPRNRPRAEPVMFVWERSLAPAVLRRARAQRRLWLAQNGMALKVVRFPRGPLWPLALVTTRKARRS